MKPPKFWNKNPNRFSPMAMLLAPLGALYARATRKRLENGAHWRPGIPVISVGNVNIGGTGKTPCAIYLVQALQEMGKKPFVITRGYGGREEGPLLVDPMRHSADQVGDEPLLLAGFGGVVMSKDRAKGAELALHQGADVLVIDDGLQNPALHYDLSICVVDGQTGFGNERVLPAGPLREPIESALARCNFLLVMGASKHDFSQFDIPRLAGRLMPLETGMDWSGLRAIAFAGIGQPAKFYRSLKDLGVEILKTHDFGDHQKIPLAMLDRLTKEARQKGAQLVTTEKDAARLPQSHRTKVLSLPVRLQLKEESALHRALANLF